MSRLAGSLHPLRGRSRPALRAAAVVAGICAVSACGSSSSSSSSTPTGSTSPTASAAGSPFCADVNAIAQLNQTFSGLKSPTLDQLKTLYGQAATSADTMAGNAPSAISADAQTFRAVIDQVNVQVHAATSLSAVQQILRQGRTDAFGAAQTHLSAYAKAQCGVDPFGGSSSASAPAQTPLPT